MCVCIPPLSTSQMPHHAPHHVPPHTTYRPTPRTAPHHVPHHTTYRTTPRTAPYHVPHHTIPHRMPLHASSCYCQTACPFTPLPATATPHAPSRLFLLLPHRMPLHASSCYCHTCVHSGGARQMPTWGTSRPALLLLPPPSHSLSARSSPHLACSCSRLSRLSWVMSWAACYSWWVAGG